MQSLPYSGPEVTPKPRAVDLHWLLNSPAVYGHFERRAGWTADRYQEWLADARVTARLGDHQEPGVA